MIPVPREVLERVRRALELTKCDAEKNGFVYGRQANVNKALTAIDKILEKNDE